MHKSVFNVAVFVMLTACEKKSWDCTMLRMTSVPLLFRWLADMLFWGQCFRVCALATIWPWMAAPTSVPNTSMVIPAAGTHRGISPALKSIQERVEMIQQFFYLLWFNFFASSTDCYICDLFRTTFNMVVLLGNAPINQAKYNINI